MLRKKYNGTIVIIIGLAIFAVSMLILWYLENKYHFGAFKNTIIACTIAVITALVGVSITIGRKGDVVIQPSDYPPSGINPIQAGCIIDDIVNARDVAAAFYYMGQKGYLQINEYELKHYEFTQGVYPESEEKSIKYIYKALFGDNAAKTNSASADVTDKTKVRLEDVAPRLINYLPKIQANTYNGIASRRNKEIADLTGKVQGFRDSMIKNRGKRIQALVDENPDYLFEILPYAYAFSITAKINSNFENVAVNMPKWYHSYGVADDYVFDVLLYNSMLRNLPEQLQKEVFDKTIDTYPAPTGVNRTM